MNEKEVELLEENLIEFELNDDISLIYSETNNNWYILDYSDNLNEEIIEDEKNDIFLKEDFTFKDVNITLSEFQSFKEKILLLK